MEAERQAHGRQIGLAKISCYKHSSHVTDKPQSQKAGGRNPRGGGHAKAVASSTKTYLGIAEDLMKRYRNALKKLAE